ncbi:hypothetical protein [Peribacillus huizhouensis]|uniref:Outer membrane lipopolysaccharide assembly protein LptE/RlpB n=1 Tax=Peribacillus huizhouensis TaxID=1501239 RepID=A0ABR6CN75_9BACI|nr:hypothetical protein [Peribacillus huizhouensis]MBA9026128.1 outer membrane lipopolysaccharide assembly protein LptE/RlpB [Peribacillus huizhouensis]
MLELKGIKSTGDENVMHKTIIALIAVVTILTACNNNGADKNKNEITEKNEQSLQTEGEQEVQQENEQSKESIQNQSKESAHHEEWASLPEYDSIMEQLDNNDYNFQTVTDNEGKRVLLLIDENGVEQYKTIFIKNTSRLKIIKINGEGQIFNEILDKK